MLLRPDRPAGGFTSGGASEVPGRDTNLVEDQARLSCLTLAEPALAMSLQLVVPVGEGPDVEGQNGLRFPRVSTAKTE